MLTLAKITDCRVRVAIVPLSARGPEFNPVASLSSSPTFRIAGTIVNAIGGSSLARARVTIVDARNRATRSRWLLPTMAVLTSSK